MNNKKKKKLSMEELIFHIILVPIFFFFVFICVYPFYYLFICSISDNNLVSLGKVLFYPMGIQFKNYVDVIKHPNLLHSAGITVLRVIIGTSGTLICNSYMAYFFTRQEMWARKVWYRIVVASMYFSAGMIPVYLNNRMLGLPNTFWIYIVPGLIGVYNMILIKTSMEAVPADLEESAYLDGAGYFTRFLRIILPLQKPILATTGLFAMVGHWNDFFTTKLYVTNTKLYTLQFVLYELLAQARAAAEQITDSKEMEGQITPKAMQMTMTCVVIIPIMCVYPFIQKFYVKGVMIGAVKG